MIGLGATAGVAGEAGPGCEAGHGVADVRSEVRPYFGNMIGAAAIVPSIRPGILASPWGHNRFRASANFGMAGAEAVSVMGIIRAMGLFDVELSVIGSALRGSS